MFSSNLSGQFKDDIWTLEIEGPLQESLTYHQYIYNFITQGDSIENEEVPGPLEEGQGSLNQSMIYMPSLRDGVMDPSRETQEKLNTQVGFLTTPCDVHILVCDVNLMG